MNLQNKLMSVLKQFEQQDYKRGGVSIAPESYNAIIQELIKTHNFYRNVIKYKGYSYYYEYRVAKDGEICLGTKDPEKYCNGFYSYSSKDEGSGMAFVVIIHNNPKELWYVND
jgi:hypothetical protein